MTSPNRAFVREELEENGIDIVHVLDCGHRIHPIVVASGPRRGDPWPRRWCKLCAAEKPPGPERCWVSRPHLEYVLEVLEAIEQNVDLVMVLTDKETESAIAAIGAALRRPASKSGDAEGRGR